MRIRREQLRPEVRARTILAGCAQARLAPSGDVASDAACTGHVGILTDPSGSAFLVLAPGHRSFEGHFRITCRAAAPGLGVLRLDGSCGQLVALADTPTLADLLALHRPSWAASVPPDVDTDDLTVVTVELEGVTVLTPATETSRAEVVPVALEAFASARPDWWLLHTDQTRARLENDHQADLVTLARCHCEDPALSPLAVAVRAIGPSHLELACLSANGVTPMTIAFGDALEHPSHVRRWITVAAGRVA